VGGALIATAAGRRTAAVATWSCYVFVHLDPEHAPPFDEWCDGFFDRIGGFRPDELVEVVRYPFELRANWKFFVENHIDVYHLWYLHAESLGVYDHPSSRWGECGERHWVFYEPPRAGLDLDATFVRGLRPIAHVDRDVWGSGAHLLFPSLPMASGAGFFMTYQCIPHGPDRTTIDVRVRAERGGDPVESIAMSKLILQDEDGAACEAMQAAVRSPWFAVGPLAREHELPITRFHRHVLEEMQ
jgi:phenylpropionate dioxygenase-like ring-hydroxylating dioxygenase large terminal subunit